MAKTTWNILELEPMGGQFDKYRVWFYVGTAQYDIGCEMTREDAIIAGRAFATEMGVNVDQISVGDE